MTPFQRTVAVGLLIERDLAVLGQGFRRRCQTTEDDNFVELLARIDAAEQVGREISQ
jgi:hypothetical protein